MVTTIKVSLEFPNPRKTLTCHIDIITQINIVTSIKFTAIDSSKPIKKVIGIRNFIVIITNFTLSNIQ